MTTAEERANVERTLKVCEGEEFDLAWACAVLNNLEHEPVDQMNSDTLWVELRLACAEVLRLKKALGEWP